MKQNRSKHELLSARFSRRSWPSYLAYQRQNLSVRLRSYYLYRIAFVQGQNNTRCAFFFFFFFFFCKKLISERFLYGAPFLTPLLKVEEFDPARFSCSLPRSLLGLSLLSTPQACGEESKDERPRGEVLSFSAAMNVI